MKIILMWIMALVVTVSLINAKAEQESLSKNNKEPLLNKDKELYSKGMSAYQQGYYHSSLDYLQKSLAIRKKLLGEEHPNTVISYNNIGTVYRLMGDSPKALKYLQKSLAIRKKLLGEEHLDTAASYNNIGAVYQLIGDSPKALKYLQKSLAIRKKVLGEEHLDTAASYNEIGAVYDSMKDYPKAIEYYQKSLAIRKKVLGEEHPNTVISYNNIGTVYRLMGDSPKALKYLQKSLTIRKKVLGEEHLDTAASYNNIGAVYQLMGDSPKALKYLQKSLAIRKKVLGEEQQSDTKQLFGAFKSSQIIHLESRQGNLAAPEGYFQIIPSKGKVTQKNIAKYNKEAFNAYMKGDYTIAITLCEKIRSILLKEPRGKELFTAENENNLALLYQSQESYQKAFTHYKNALEVSKKLYGDNHPQTAVLYGNMAILYQQLGNLKKALSLHQKSLKIREKVLGEVHPDTALSYHNLGAFYQNEYIYMNPKAYDYYYKALTIRKKVLGEDHLDTAMTYSALSSLNYERDGYRTGMQYAYNAMTSALKHVDKTHMKMATIYRNLGRLSYWMGNSPQSQKYLQKALTIRKSVLGNDHIMTLEVYRDLILLGKHEHDVFLQRYKYAILITKSFLKKRDTIFPILGKEEKEQYIKKYSENIALLFYIVDRGLDQLFRENNYTRADEIVNEIFNIWLNYKGSIFDSENAIASLYTTTEDKETKKQIDLLNRAKRKLAKLYQSLPKHNEKEQWRQQIKITEKEIVKLNKLIATKAEKVNQQEALNKIDSKMLANALNKDELYIDYAELDGYYYIFTLDNDGKVSFEQIYGQCLWRIGKYLPSFRKDITAILGNSKLSKTQLADLTRSSQEKLSELHTCILNMSILKLTEKEKEIILFGPRISLESQLQKKKSLIISSDGALRLLPFEALYNKKKDRYLIEEKDIRYVPSGKELMRLHKFTSLQKAAKKDVVIFYNPDFNQKTGPEKMTKQVASLPTPYRSAIIKSLFRMRFLPLPGTQIEAKKIEALLKDQPIDLYPWDRATESNLFTIKEPKILHIATHGFFLNDNSIPNPMLKSGIALSGANTSAIHGKDGGIITALKLSGLELKGTDLVVLSACQTGEVDINSTESVSGLSKAFIQAGAKNMIISLWSVDDKATVDLMASFYYEAKKLHHFSRALKEAKLEMIRNHLHPFYWAAFVLYGL